MNDCLDGAEEGNGCSQLGGRRLVRCRRAARWESQAQPDRSPRRPPWPLRWGLPLAVTALATVSCAGEPGTRLAPPEPAGPHVTTTADSPASGAAAQGGATVESPVFHGSPAVPTADVTLPPCAAQQHRGALALLPAGSVLAWSDCSGTWVAQDGVPRRISDIPDASTIRIAPDRKHVAIAIEAENGRIDVHAVGLEGEQALLVVDGEALASRVPVSAVTSPTSMTAVEYFDWHTDSTALAFTTWEIDFTQESSHTHHYRDDLWVVGLDESAPRMILDAGEGGHFVYSPDGTRVAVSAIDHVAGEEVARISVAMADGSQRRMLLEHVRLSWESDVPPHALPQWSPDGKALYAVAPQRSSEDQEGTGSLAYFDSPVQLVKLYLDGRRESVAQAGPNSVPLTQNYNACWSPDGKSVAYVEAMTGGPAVATETEGSASIGYGAPTPTFPDSESPRGPRAVEGSGARILMASVGGSSRVWDDDVPHGLDVCAWSPSGKRLAYWSLDHEPTGRIPVRPLMVGMQSAHPFELTLVVPWPKLYWGSDEYLLVQQSDRLDLHSVARHSLAPVQATLLSNAEGIAIDIAPAP